LGAAGKLPANASLLSTYASLDQKKRGGTRVAALPKGGLAVLDKDGHVKLKLRI